MTRPAIDCVIATPAHRCPPQLAPAYAVELAQLALSMLRAAPEAGLRMGLEAHYLFAVASEQQVLAMRYQFQDFGPAWARVLLACSRVFQDRGTRRWPSIWRPGPAAWPCSLGRSRSWTARCSSSCATAWNGTPACWRRPATSRPGRRRWRP